MKSLRRYIPEIEIIGDQVSPDTLDTMEIRNNDFKEGMKEIIPTAMREFYVEVSRVKWENGIFSNTTDKQTECNSSL